MEFEEFKELQRKLNEAETEMQLTPEKLKESQNVQVFSRFVDGDARRPPYLWNMERTEALLAVLNTLNLLYNDLNKLIVQYEVNEESKKEEMKLIQQVHPLGLIKNPGALTFHKSSSPTSRSDCIYFVDQSPWMTAGFKVPEPIIYHLNLSTGFFQPWLEGLPSVDKMEIMDDTLYALCPGKIYRISINNRKLISTWNTKKASKRGTGLHLDSKLKRLYFTLDYDHYIYVYHSETGEEITEYGGPCPCVKEKEREECDAPNGKFFNPQMIAGDERSLYICDQANHCVQVIGKENGRFICLFKKKFFHHPRSIALYDNNDVYVADYQRLYLFTKDGTFIREVKPIVLQQDNCGFCVVGNRVYIPYEDRYRKEPRPRIEVWEFE